MVRHRAVCVLLFVGLLCAFLLRAEAAGTSKIKSIRFRPAISDLRSNITAIYATLQKEQVQQSRPYSPPLNWQEDKGLYRSYIHVDSVGSELADLVRNLFAIPDSNMFVTSFVVSAILESHGLGTLKADPQSLQMAIEAIAGYHDKNRPANVPAYVFWPQTMMNGTWSATPINLLKPIEYFDSWAAFVEAILTDIGLGYFADEIADMVSGLDTTAQAFRIPPDLDDSSVNLAMGGMLLRLAPAFPSAYSLWEKSNIDISALFDLETKYAYKSYGSPRSDYTDMLDPRTYYLFNSYMAENPQTDLALTWLANLEDDIKTSPYVSMPFHTNNVDLSVSANFLYGTAHAALQSLNNGAAKKAFMTNNAIQKLFTDTAKLVAWGVKSGAAITRPDISLLYYPSIYDFLWMAARTARFLASHNETTEVPVLSQARDVLLDALYEAGTYQIIGAAQHAPNGIYWDDFLGDDGGVARGEDRLFSTALAVNTLIDIWTNGFAAFSSAEKQVGGKKTCQLQWRSETPEAVKATIDSGVAFLSNEMLAGNLELENAFFSGSMKSLSTNPFSYPGTYSKYLNGTAVDPSMPNFPPGTSGTELVFAMRGLANSADYQKWLTRKWFGFTVPTTFDGFNTGGLGPWPYWSSPAMTYAMGLIALSNYVALEDC